MSRNSMCNLEGFFFFCTVSCDIHSTELTECGFTFIPPDEQIFVDWRLSGSTVNGSNAMFPVKQMSYKGIEIL